MRDYLDIVLRRWLMAATACLAVIVLAALYTWTRTPRYEARAQILVEQKQIDLTDVRGAQESVAISRTSLREHLETQVKLILSRPVIEAAIDQVGLLADRDYSDAKDPAAKLTDALTVQPVRNSQLIEVSIEREDPRQAADLVNAVVESFQRESAKRRFGISEDGIVELRKKAESLRLRLDDASSRLHAFMVEKKMVSLEKSQDIVLERFRDMNRQLTLVEPRRMAVQARLDAAQTAMANGQAVDALPDVLASQVIKSLKLDLARLEQEYSKMLPRLGENHPQLQSLATQIDTLRTKLAIESSSIVACIGNEYEQAKREESLIREALGAQENEVLRLNAAADEYDMLRRSKELIENTYNTIIRRIEEVDINSMVGQGENIFVVSQAHVPTQASWPRKGRNMLVALVMAGFFSVGLCFFIDYMDASIKGEEEITRLGCNVVGRIPDAETGSGQEPGSDLIVQEQSASHAAEAFRSLRTALIFGLPAGRARSLVVSSALPGEGKSLVAVNLALAHAQAGNRTLIVDGDMRKPRLHRVFSVSSNKGLAGLLADDGETGIQDWIVATGVKNLSVLPCGAIPTDPVALLSSGRYGAILRELESQFDFVVIDSPPGVSLADPCLEGRDAGGLLLVIRSFCTPTHAVQEIVAKLREARVTLSGVVLNNVDLPSSPYHHGYYYNYGRHYGDHGPADECSRTGRAVAWTRNLAGIVRRRCASVIRGT